MVSRTILICNLATRSLKPWWGRFRLSTPPYTYFAKAIDPDNDPLTYRLTVALIALINSQARHLGGGDRGTYHFLARR